MVYHYLSSFYKTPKLGIRNNESMNKKKRESKSTGVLLVLARRRAPPYSDFVAQKKQL
jgi:hypothetical protein